MTFPTVQVLLALAASNRRDSVAEKTITFQIKGGYVYCTCEGVSITLTNKVQYLGDLGELHVAYAWFNKTATVAWVRPCKKWTIHESTSIEVSEVPVSRTFRVADVFYLPSRQKVAA